MDFDNTELAIDSPAELIPATPAGATLELAEQRYSSVIDGVVAYISSIDLSPAIVEEAATFLVTSKDDLAEAAILRTRLKNIESRVEEPVDPVIKLIRTGLDRLYEAKRNALAPGVQADGWLKRRMEEYQAVEKRKAVEAEQAAQRAQAEARRVREESERAAREAQSAEAREIARQDMERARQQEENAKRARVAAAVTVATPAKIAGAKTRTTKAPEVTDMQAFLAGVVGGMVPEACVEVNRPFLMELWREDRAMVLAMPGVEVVEKVTVSR